MLISKLKGMLFYYYYAADYAEDHNQLIKRSEEWEEYAMREKRLEIIENVNESHEKSWEICNELNLQ